MGLIQKINNHSIFVKTWSQVVSEFEIRHSFINKHLYVQKNKLIQEVQDADQIVDIITSWVLSFDYSIAILAINHPKRTFMPKTPALYIDELTDSASNPRLGCGGTGRRGTGRICRVTGDGRSTWYRGDSRCQTITSSRQTPTLHSLTGWQQSSNKLVPTWSRASTAKWWSPTGSWGGFYVTRGYNI